MGAAAIIRAAMAAVAAAAGRTASSVEAFRSKLGPRAARLLGFYVAAGVSACRVRRSPAGRHGGLPLLVTSNVHVRGADEFGVGFVDFLERVADGPAGMRGEAVYVLANRREGRAHDLKIFIDDLGRE
jgi:hypothetical protein